MTWRWRRTKWGPLAPGLAERFGQPCEVVTRAKRPATAILVRFGDGYEVVTMRYAVRA